MTYKNDVLYRVQGEISNLKSQIEEIHTRNITNIQTLQRDIANITTGLYGLKDRIKKLEEDQDISTFPHSLGKPIISEKNLQELRQILSAKFYIIKNPGTYGWESLIECYISEVIYDFLNLEIKD